MGKVLVLLIVAFFSFAIAAEQKRREAPLIICEQGLCIFPPVVGITPENKPRRVFIENLREFHGLYVESLKKKLLISGRPENFWWIMTLLRPECGKEEWCIEINIAEEKKGSKRILVTRLFLSEEESFDAGTEAEKAAEKTKIVILPVKKL